MTLPPEIQERLKRGNITLPLEDPEEEDVAIVKGKTAIPFSSFVQLILKKKVMGLFKEWDDEPIVFSSTLLTKIANCPQDKVEDKNKLILTALTVGLCVGISLSAATLLILWTAGVTVGQRELLVLLGSMFVVGAAVFGSTQIHASKHVQKITDQIEQIAEGFGK